MKNTYEKRGIYNKRNMEIAVFITSTLAIIISIVALIPSLLAYKKTKFKLHLTCEKYEDNGEIFGNFMFINPSLEPYSVLRLDYILGDEIQFIGIDELLRSLPNTLVPPREAIIFTDIKLAFSRKCIEHVDNDPKLLNCIKVYTTKRNDPYCIHLRNGMDDSIIQVVPKTKTVSKKQKVKPKKSIVQK